MNCEIIERMYDAAGARPEDPYKDLAEAFTGHYETVRGALRYELAAAQLEQYLPRPPADVLEIGGGDGRQAVRLADLDYRVTLTDPSADMLSRAAVNLEQWPQLQRRINLVQSAGEQLPDKLLGKQFDVVLCQGVLMFLEDPVPVVETAAELAKPGGVISIITKNADALAMRPALEGRYGAAIKAFDAVSDVGGLGVETRAHTLAQLTEWLEESGAAVEAWYGIRVFTDHLGDARIDDHFPAIMRAESEAGQRDPYRRVARLLHVIARKRH